MFTLSRAHSPPVALWSLGSRLLAPVARVRSRSVPSCNAPSLAPPPPPLRARAQPLRARTVLVLVLVCLQYMCTSVRCALQESTTAASDEVEVSDSPPASSPAEDETSRAESAADQCAAAAKRSTSAPQRRKRAPLDTRAFRFVELLATQPAIPFPRTCAARFANGTIC